MSLVIFMFVKDHMLNPTDRPLSDLQFSLVGQKTFKEVRLMSEGPPKYDKKSSARVDASKDTVWPSPKFLTPAPENPPVLRVELSFSKLFEAFLSFSKLFFTPDYCYVVVHCVRETTTSGAHISNNPPSSGNYRNHPPHQQPRHHLEIAVISENASEIGR